MEHIVIIRAFLIPGALVIFLLVAALVKPPKRILERALGWCWGVGLMNFIVDVVQEHFGFWHYTIGNLFFSYPIDLYIAASLVVGGAIPLIYWRLQFSHPKWIAPITVLLPFYFLLEDYLVQRSTGSMVVIWDSPYWWSADFISLSFILWVAFFIFTKLREQK